jgi:LmbE family N-acetylglucosaminyl deacetylase
MESLRVFVICAHPDDYEYSASATLNKLAVNGNIIRGIVLTHGEKGGNGTSRAVEATESAKKLGIKHAEVMNFPDTKLPEYVSEISVVIKRVISEFDPHLIFTHSGHDKHQDHRAVNEATMKAAEHRLVFCFESPSSRNFKADCGVHIGDKSLAHKLECIATHSDQRNKLYMNPEYIVNWIKERNNAEQFEIGDY